MVESFSLIALIKQLSYLGTFLHFSAIGYVVPIPEEIVLAILGSLAAVGKINLWLAWLASLLGVLAGESVIFWLTVRGSKQIDKLKAKAGASALAKYERLMVANLFKTMLAIRFLIGLRFLCPIISASIGVKWKKFLGYEALIVGGYLAVFVGLGYSYHRHLNTLFLEIQNFRQFLIIIAVVVLAMFIFAKVISRFRNKRYYTPGHSPAGEPDPQSVRSAHSVPPQRGGVFNPLSCDGDSVNTKKSTFSSDLACRNKKVIK